MVPFQKTFAKNFWHINPIAVMENFDTFDRIVLQIGVSLIDIGSDVGTRLSLDFQILLCLQNMRSQYK